MQQMAIQLQIPVVTGVTKFIFQLTVKMLLHLHRLVIILNIEHRPPTDRISCLTSFAETSNHIQIAPEKLFTYFIVAVYFQFSVKNSFSESKFGSGIEIEGKLVEKKKVLSKCRWSWEIGMNFIIF